MKPTLDSALAAFGRQAKARLSNPTVTGEPEDQLRGPLENLIADLAEVIGLARQDVTTVGETSLADLKTRPDYAVTVHGALVGFIEVKAPGKGADPRRFKGHDKIQWEKLQSLPNLLYTDGNAFSLWRNGHPEGEVLRLVGNIETAGDALRAAPGLQRLFEEFFRWEPLPPRDVRQLAEVSARLCRLLREEVGEQLAAQHPTLTSLAADWRKLLFPEASDAQFADGYAQTVTFGLLMARARNIRLRDGLDQVARQLGQNHSLIGSALRLLTDDAQSQATLTTSLKTLVRVLDAVDWAVISKGKTEAWLYFYEEFLGVYDNGLRKKTGSYYTPPEVVDAMVRLVDETLRNRFALPGGLAAPAVTVADPAVGTGTFLLGVLRRIARRFADDEGPGAVPAAIRSAASRLVGFELQLGPFAVAQLRILAELAELMGTAAVPTPRMFVTDTLADPYAEERWIPSMLQPIAESRKQANQVKREPITVVIGNPPYKEKALGRGGWVEAGSPNAAVAAPLLAWLPPKEWGVGTHAKHLRNLYVYFWRWATWKVFDHPPHDTGIVCFITVAGFLNGPGFQRMREYLRQKASDLYVIDCSPEGHQPEVNTRLFEGVQQPVCIVLAARAPGTDPDVPAPVHFRALPAGHRREKLAALTDLTLDGTGWTTGPTDWRASFLPDSAGDWGGYPALDELFLDNSSGVMPGRTWVIAPDADSLRRRWQTLLDAPTNQKEDLFQPHLNHGQPGDRHVNRVVLKGLPGYPDRTISIGRETGPANAPVPYAFRSFDRQWIIPDNRLLNRPNPDLWARHSDRQVYLTAPSDRSPTSGPALTFTALIPDLHHYNGRGGRVFPLWQDAAGTEPNVPAQLLGYLTAQYGRVVDAPDLLAYLAAVAAHPAFTARYRADLTKPGLRVPLTADGGRFAEAVELGRTVLWLHTFGERFADAARGRPAAPPRQPDGPRIPAEGALPSEPGTMPDDLRYDAGTRRLHVGSGFVENVEPAVWDYEVSGKKVLRQWFSYRKADRERPVMGDRRPPSALGTLQPDHWLAAYTTELLRVLHVLTRLVALEPAQAALLDRLATGPLLSGEALRAAGALGGAGTPAVAAPVGQGQQLRFF